MPRKTLPLPLRRKPISYLPSHYVILPNDPFVYPVYVDHFHIFFALMSKLYFPCYILKLVSYFSFFILFIHFILLLLRLVMVRFFIVNFSARMDGFI